MLSTDAGWDSDLHLVHQCGRRVVGDHQPALDARSLGEERGQAGREMRIHEACSPPFGDRRQLRDGHRGVVERQRQRLAVEVAAADHLSRREDEWVVGRRVDLDAEDALELRQRVASGAVDLRHASEAVGVLHAVLGIGAMGRPDLAVRQQRAQVPGRCDLPRMRARGDQLLREGGAGAEHRLEAHRADDVGGQRQPNGVVVSERANPGHELGPVEQRQAFLCLQLDRLERGARQRLGSAARAGTVDGRLALPDEHERDVGQRREVARRAETATRRDDRMDRRVQHRDEEVDDLDSHAGEPDRQGVRPKEEHRPHDVIGQRVADAGGMGADEIALEGRRLRGVDARIGQISEAGGDAIDSCAVGHEPLDHGPRRTHPIRRCGFELDGPSAPRDLDDVIDGEVPAGERKGRHRSLYYAPCDGCRTS